MATTRIMPLHAGKGRTVGKAISDIIDYVKNPDKTDHGKLITGYGCDSRTADAEFLLAKRQYIAATGRVRGKDDVIAYHLRQSFVPGEITPEEANRLGVELARRFTKGRHAFIVCTHIDKSHTHNHIIWNSTTLECDRKFRNFWGSTRAVHRLSDTICIENGYSIVVSPKGYGQSYHKWLGDTAKPSHKEQLRQTIDQVLAQKPASLEELLRLLEQDGFTVHRRSKTISIGAKGWGNNVRFDRLGDGYTLDDLLAVLSGQKHTPRKKNAAQVAPPKVNLLVDIQEKLQAGKGAGYARWAKVFNLKQMAQTLNYLSEHGLLNYADLETKTAKATFQYNRLSDQIKAAEKRMAEIAVLRTHIVNYAKTRDTYVTYRKAGYSRKFYMEHGDEIRLHQAAKEAFNELNVKKLPTVKELQTEYAKLLADKKKAYGEYRQARSAMRELLTVKNNVDRVLAMGPTEPQEKEKDHGQR
ncbi:relaxase/mobilization nuclease domain-containing protein [uncultured Subdoligranulum sp.]|uniref:relaxase/mobilization nuclease domain-containing protein n=1 Tax=uncultured Subdoligranulum sp. TaxID=512298 RepID=UPI00262FD7BD|nr:relaxase/mobilization nuclease domain-containing protein [uncultured Subdoligranulum sp.]